MTSAPAKIHEGKVVSMTGDKLTTACNDGKQHCHTVSKDAAITCDGVAKTPADLKAGTPVRVTPHKDDKNVATAVTFSKPAAAASHKA